MDLSSSHPVSTDRAMVAEKQQKQNQRDFLALIPTLLLSTTARRCKKKPSETLARSISKGLSRSAARTDQLASTRPQKRHYKRFVINGSLSRRLRILNALLRNERKQISQSARTNGAGDEPCFQRKTSGDFSSKHKTSAISSR